MSKSSGFIVTYGVASLMAIGVMSCTVDTSETQQPDDIEYRIAPIEGGGGTYCGDGVCNGGETCSSCWSDCGSCPVQTYCGDGVCNGSETCSSCSSDCGACPAPTATFAYRCPSNISITNNVVSAPSGWRVLNSTLSYSTEGPVSGTFAVNQKIVYSNKLYSQPGYDYACWYQASGYHVNTCAPSNPDYNTGCLVSVTVIPSGFEPSASQVAACPTGSNRYYATSDADANAMYARSGVVAPLETNYGMTDTGSNPQYFATWPTIYKATRVCLDYDPATYCTSATPANFNTADAWPALKPYYSIYSNCTFPPAKTPSCGSGYDVNGCCINSFGQMVCI